MSYFFKIAQKVCKRVGRFVYSEKESECRTQAIFARELSVHYRAEFNCFRGINLSILVPRARRFLVTWSGNDGLWKQPLPDVRKFLTSGCEYAELTNITAHAHNGFFSFTAPLGEKFYSLSSLQRVAFLGWFENAPLHSTWIH